MAAAVTTPENDDDVTVRPAEPSLNVDTTAPPGINPNQSTSNRLPCDSDEYSTPRPTPQSSRENRWEALVWIPEIGSVDRKPLHERVPLVFEYHNLKITPKNVIWSCTSTPNT